MCAPRVGKLKHSQSCHKRSILDPCFFGFIIKILSKTRHLLAAASLEPSESVSGGEVTVDGW